MTEKTPTTRKDFQFHASLPKYFRIVAIAAGVATVLIVVAGFYNSRSRSPFKLKSEHTQLSTDVVAEVSGYERLESDDGVAKYYVKADHAKTFSDNHQELENVYLEIYDAEGSTTDKMAADSALYVPEEEKNFTAYLKGNVRIETSEALKVKTDHITYTKRTETAESDEAVEFERETVRGKSFGATVKMAEKRIELLKDVEIETFESPELAKANVRYAKVNAASASFDQAANKIELNQNVAINIQSTAKTGNAQTTDVNASRAVLQFIGEDANSAKFKQFELFENVAIATSENGSATNINSGYALYDKAADRYELKHGTHIVTSANNKPTDIKAVDAIFEQSAKKLALTGSAEITQGSEYLKGDTLHADLFPDNQIKHAVIRGNALARQTSVERATTVTAPELNATFNDARHLQDANAVGESSAEIVPANMTEYAKVTMNAGRGIGLSFRGEGLLEKMVTDGRTTINMTAPNSNGANKRLTADNVVTIFNTNGRDISRAEAVGNAELFIEPLTASTQNYRTTITAPRFDCDFYPTGNNAKVCVGGKKAKTVRVPTMPTERRGTQNLTADTLTASFSQLSHDIETLDATGSTKFTENDRNAIARRMVYTQSDETVRIREGEPTVWDSAARAKAHEIDWNTRENKSYLRGNVSTTYYSRQQMKDAAPFGSSADPVFITSQTAEFDHTAETALYIGNARGWQENNYVRGDRLHLDQKAGKMHADGKVQSLLYDAKLKQKAKETTVPVYAAANSLVYDRDKRLLQYRTGVDIRQGTDRITSGAADIFLTEKNEVSKTVAESNVVITQPDRRGTGDWAQYTADDEVAILRGKPAIVTDAQTGTSQGEQLTFNLRDNRMTAESAPKPGTPGRSRSVYKVKSSQ